MTKHLEVKSGNKSDKLIFLKNFKSDKGGCLKYHLLFPRSYISRYYKAIVGQKFQKPSFAMFENNFYW